MESLKYIRIVIMIAIVVLSVFWIKSCKKEDKPKNNTPAQTENQSVKKG